MGFWSLCSASFELSKLGDQGIQGVTGPQGGHGGPGTAEPQGDQGDKGDYESSVGLHMVFSCKKICRKNSAGIGSSSGLPRGLGDGLALNLSK